jgi:hypothetical protein
MASGTRDQRPPLRLRIPAALAITLLGGTAIVGQSFVGCEEGIPEPIDAGRIFNERDAGIDGLPIDTGPPLPEASIDGGPVDAAVADAYVPPDTPVG